MLLSWTPFSPLKVTVPPLEEQLLPPPFGGGGDGSLLFPSPPLEGKALYGLSTWSFGSHSSGGGDSGGGSEQAAWKPPEKVSSSKRKQVCTCKSTTLYCFSASHSVYNNTKHSCDVLVSQQTLADKKCLVKINTPSTRMVSRRTTMTAWPTHRKSLHSGC